MTTTEQTRRILVTGGAGFIGSHIVDACVQRGWEVTVVDDLSTGRRDNVNAAARFVELDLRDAEGVSRLVKKLRPDAVSHQAAQSSVAVSMREPAFDVAVNVLGTIHLLDACVRHSVERLVFASTGGAIYGEVPDGQLASESHPVDPISPYAISKLAAEKLIDVYRREHGLGATVLRYANVYGPRQDPHGEAGVVAIFLRGLLDGRPLKINARRSAGDDGCVRDYVYVADVVAANLKALEGQVPYPVMNVCTGVGTTTAGLLSSMEQALGLAALREPNPHRAGDLERSVLEPRLPLEVLGRLLGLEEGVRRTAEWFRAGSQLRSVKE